MAPPSKYTLNDTCDWCGAKHATQITVQTNGVKAKRYAVVAMACAACARRLLPSE